MDYRMASDFSSPYSIIYGHNVRDGSMLSDLALLKDQKLYDEEPYFWILTPKGTTAIRFSQFFSVTAQQMFFSGLLTVGEKIFPNGKVN